MRAYAAATLVNVAVTSILVIGGCAGESTDLGETTIVGSAHPEILNELLEELSQWEEDVDRSARRWEN